MKTRLKHNREQLTVARCLVRRLAADIDSLRIKIQEETKRIRTVRYVLPKEEFYDCFACGDVASSILKYDGNGYCEECYEELAHDKIRNQNINLGCGYKGRGDEPSPWQENAIRVMEDRGMD